jgi:hypothetical protein
VRIVCIFTAQLAESKAAADLCVKSGRRFGYDVERYESVFCRDMDAVHKRYRLKRRYQPSFEHAGLTRRTCPATRMANGTTHYILYRWCVETGWPLCIVEHDAEFVGEIPAARPGVIQISSHIAGQMDQAHKWLESSRGKRMLIHEPERKAYWTDAVGVVRHPLSGTTGTSGYIISPEAAQAMVDYIHDSGIAFADRIRTAHIGEGNLWLQKPQSVTAHHNRAKSHQLIRQ